MSDFKSKLPDMKELGSMASKLFNGVKQSVTEIVEDYKKKRETGAQEEKSTTNADIKPKKAPQEQPTEPANANPIPPVDNTTIKTPNVEPVEHKIAENLPEQEASDADKK